MPKNVESIEQPLRHLEKFAQQGSRPEGLAKKSGALKRGLRGLKKNLD
jgi:hypothetical protein